MDLSKILVIVDMQNDFVTGCLGTKEAQKIVPKIKEYADNFDGNIVATQDTHFANYFETQEGRNLPVMHCQYESEGWKLVPELRKYQKDVLEKTTFGSTKLGEMIKDGGYTHVEICGVCTDICVISNAMLIKAYAPEAEITVLSEMCAGVTTERHETALKAMAACQIAIAY